MASSSIKLKAESDSAVIKMINAAANGDERKLEMEEEKLKDLKWALGLNELGAKVLGVWPSEEHVKSEPWHVKLRAPFMIALMFFWVCVPQTWGLILVIDDLSLVIDNLMSNFGAFGCCIKLLFLWRSRQKMVTMIEVSYQLIDDVEVMLPVVESAKLDWLRSKSIRERELMLDNAWGMRLVTIVDYGLMALSLVGFTAFPLLDIDTRLINNITDYGDRHLLLQSYYPFDYTKTPYFEVTQVLQYFGGLFAAVTITVPENYFGMMVIHLSSQFEILGLELERLFSDDFENGKPRENHLAGLIQRHAHLIQLVQTLDASFTFVTFGQIFMTCVILCSYGFQFLALIGLSNEKVAVLQIVTLLCIMTTLMLHTLVDCVVGEFLSGKSTDLMHSIYKCHWYAVDGKRARDLVPMMISSRRQKPLNAGKIMPLSLSTYCTILKTTISYISVLVVVNTK